MWGVSLTRGTEIMPITAGVMGTKDLEVTLRAMRDIAVGCSNSKCWMLTGLKRKFD